jgi:hypothetical protein
MCPHTLACVNPPARHKLCVFLHTICVLVPQRQHPHPFYICPFIPYVSIRQHTSAEAPGGSVVHMCPHNTSAYVSIRHVSIRQQKHLVEDLLYICVLIPHLCVSLYLCNSMCPHNSILCVRIPLPRYVSSYHSICALIHVCVSSYLISWIYSGSFINIPPISNDSCC